MRDWLYQRLPRSIDRGIVDKLFDSFGDTEQQAALFAEAGRTVSDPNRFWPFRKNGNWVIGVGHTIGPVGELNESQQAELDKYQAGGMLRQAAYAHAIEQAKTSVGAVRRTMRNNGLIDVPKEVVNSLATLHQFDGDDLFSPELLNDLVLRDYAKAFGDVSEVTNAPSQVASATADVSIDVGNSAGTEDLITEVLRNTAANETGRADYTLMSQIANEANGTKSYGILGLNSGAGTSGTEFAAKYGEKLGLTAPIGSSEFDTQWLGLVNNNPQGLIDAHRSYADESLIKPAQQMLRQNGLGSIADDDGAINMVSDMIVQYGPGLTAGNLRDGAALGSTETVDIIRDIGRATVENVDKNFKTHLSKFPEQRQGLINRLNNRVTQSIAYSESGNRRPASVVSDAATSKPVVDQTFQTPLHVASGGGDAGGIPFTRPPSTGGRQVSFREVPAAQAPTREEFLSGNVNAIAQGNTQEIGSDVLSALGLSGTQTPVELLASGSGGSIASGREGGGITARPAATDQGVLNLPDLTGRDTASLSAAEPTGNGVVDRILGGISGFANEDVSLGQRAARAVNDVRDILGAGSTATQVGGSLLRQADDAVTNPIINALQGIGSSINNGVNSAADALQNSDFGQAVTRVGQDFRDESAGNPLGTEAAAISAEDANRINHLIQGSEFRRQQSQLNGTNTGPQDNRSQLAALAGLPQVQSGSVLDNVTNVPFAPQIASGATREDILRQGFQNQIEQVNIDPQIDARLAEQQQGLERRQQMTAINLLNQLTGGASTATNRAVSNLDSLRLAQGTGQTIRTTIPDAPTPSASSVAALLGATENLQKFSDPANQGLARQGATGDVLAQINANRSFLGLPPVTPQDTLTPEAQAGNAFDISANQKTRNDRIAAIKQAELAVKQRSANANLEGNNAALLDLIFNSSDIIHDQYRRQ